MFYTIVSRILTIISPLPLYNTMKATRCPIMVFMMASIALITRPLSFSHTVCNVHPNLSLSGRFHFLRCLRKLSLKKNPLPISRGWRCPNWTPFARCGGLGCLGRSKPDLAVKCVLSICSTCFLPWKPLPHFMVRHLWESCIHCAAGHVWHFGGWL